ncbi:hypothetical protein [Pseudomonas sp. dw_612]|uniref:hypothetical protein n=1 Tax=Pseudomonas sp. dw_612 TaxID=2720080 RepID=UPI001BD286AF|nr:hypothetical protein [Pseudomonas sp. dw_612]
MRKADVYVGEAQTTVGAAEGCDLLILIFKVSEKIKVKRSQPSAAPTGDLGGA